MVKRNFCDVSVNSETESSRTKRMRLRNERAREIHAEIDAEVAIETLCLAHEGLTRA
jgi:hypothetical protein